MKKFIIGIAGGSGSGKTTFSNRLFNELTELKFNIRLFSCDNYYKEIKPTLISPVSRIEYIDFNHPDSIDFNKLYNDIEDSIASDEIDIIIIEGLFVLYDDRLRDYLDLKIYIDVESDERLYRRIKRHMAWGQKIDEIAIYYLDAVRNRHEEFIEPSRWQADIVVNGTHITNLSTDMIKQWAFSNVKK